MIERKDNMPELNEFLVVLSRARIVAKKAWHKSTIASLEVTNDRLRAGYRVQLRGVIDAVHEMLDIYLNDTLYNK